MFKTILLTIMISTSVNASYSFNFPSLDFNMAENAILNSKAIQSAEADLGEEAVDAEKIGKKTYRVTFEGGCDLTAKFGKRSKVYIVEDSFFCN
jgi:hypothetical protein